MNTVLIYLEGSGSTLKRTSFECITASRSLEASSIIGVIIHGTTEQIAAVGAYGLSKVINITNPDLSSFDSGLAAAAVSSVAADQGATAVLFAANAIGKELAPRVAIRLQAGLLPDCVELIGTASALEAVRPVYAGKARVRVKATTPVTVATLRPNVFTARQADTAVDVDASNWANALPAVRSATVVGVQRNEGVLDVAEADIVVSGGRGLKGPENFHLVESLARTLNGAVGASRAVVDAGWRPHREQVGQTGKTVSPNMYVACGISGAVQHLAGMSSSRFIVAVNKDKDAPIFKIADYGIVGDVFEVLPKLTERIAKVTGR
jgi:electron transfer flavoprotein alpha subunit